MKPDHFKDWLAAANREENPNTTNWDLLVCLTKHSFSTGELPTEAAWGAMVILPKPDGGVRGIGLLEAFWKLCSKIIDLRVQASVQFHDSLHGFRARRGTGTAIIEAKLFQQLAMADQVAVYEIFLDLSKAYDCVDRD